MRLNFKFVTFLRDKKFKFNTNNNNNINFIRLTILIKIKPRSNEQVGTAKNPFVNRFIDKTCFLLGKIDGFR